MTGEQYLLLGYIVALGMLWGYAAHLLWLSRSLRQREGARGGQAQPD
ncbi:MAG: hypothetical protein ACYTGG_07510 [Planctomycetota bacterium]|jgi:hypothetical protein